MAILTDPKAQAILQDAIIRKEELMEIEKSLEPFLDRYLPLFKRSEQREHARLHVKGRLSRLTRKTSEPIATNFGVRREQLQDFLGGSPWSDDDMLRAIRSHVFEVFPDAMGVVTGDGSGFPKKGAHSCGVQRQYCGHLGKVENCQIGIFLGYACRRGRLLLDHRLFLPKEWAQDEKRRQTTGVPGNVVYQEAWQILLDLLDRCVGLPRSWFVADAEFGRVCAFRQGLRQRKERYVVDVPQNLLIRDLQRPAPLGPTNRQRKAPIIGIEQWEKECPKSAWEKYEIRGGEKGPLLVESAQSLVQTMDNKRLGKEQERLVVIRTSGAQEARTWYTLSNTGLEVPLADLVWAHGQRYWHEGCFQQGKSEVGMDHYEVRGWRGWHHHMTMTTLTLWFLVLSRYQAKKNASDYPEYLARRAESDAGVRVADIGEDCE